jgi:hypothetical protein
MVDSVDIGFFSPPKFQNKDTPRERVERVGGVFNCQVSELRHEASKQCPTLQFYICRYYMYI